jgi:hypothetical protein
MSSNDKFIDLMQQQQNTSTSANVMFQKPDSVDTPIYEKPNAYDEEPPVIITASRHGSKSSKMTVDSFASRYFQKREPTIVSTITSRSSSITAHTITKDTGTYYSPHTPVESPPLSPKTPTKSKLMYNSQITSFILSQSTPTTQTTFGHHHQEDEKESTPTSYCVLPSSPANSIIGEAEGEDDETLKKSTSTNVAAAAAALLSHNDSGIVSSFFLQQHKRHKGTIAAASKVTNKNNSYHIKNKRSSNTVIYSIRKASILKPNQHNIYLHIDHLEDEDDEEVMIYRKVHPFSYTWWGFQSMLYCNKNDGQGIKVAETRSKRAFGGKDNIVIESADYDNSEINDITQPHIPNLKNTPATNNIHCQDLIKKSQSNILFEYEIWFHGSRMRWKRPSLLSHDFTCEIKLTRQETKLYYQQAQQGQQKKSNSITRKQKKRNSKSVTKEEENRVGGFIDSDSDNDEDDHDNHTHKSCRRWKLIAEFDSQNMSYLNKEFGKLSIDLDILNQVEKERCDLLEANIVMTCCTLIDLIRDVMGK